MGGMLMDPELSFDIGNRELNVLRAELEQIADGAPPLASTAAELANRLGSLAALPTNAFEPRSSERVALRRALDHLRSLGHEGELMTLRERVLLTSAVEPIAYRLRQLFGGSPTWFWSYSREYRQGDRIVRDVGEEYRVVEVRAGDPAVLLADHWHPS